MTGQQLVKGCLLQIHALSVLYYAQLYDIRVMSAQMCLLSVPACFALRCPQCTTSLGNATAKMCQCSHVDASTHTWWNAAGSVPLLLKILTTARQDPAYTWVLFARHSFCLASCLDKLVGVWTTGRARRPPQSSHSQHKRLCSTVAAAGSNSCCCQTEQKYA